MTKDRYYYDFPDRLKSTKKYYRFEEFPEAIFLIEAENFDPLAHTTNQKESEPKGIVFALGTIVTLIVLSVFQLYRALEATPSSPEITKSKPTSTIMIPPSKFDRLPNH